MLNHTNKRRNVNQRGDNLRRLLSEAGTILAFAVIGAIALSSASGCHRNVRALLLGGPDTVVEEVVQ